MSYRRLVLTVFVVINGALVGCTNPPPLNASTSPTARTADATKAASSQAPVAAPTHITWAVDKRDDPARPYVLVLFFDSHAVGFRIVDESARLVLQVPIAGSGIFGPGTCVQRLVAAEKTEDYTWVAFDATTLQQFTANASSYRVEVDTIGGPTITLPMTDSGCRSG